MNVHAAEGSNEQDGPAGTDGWLTLPEVAEALGWRVRDVRAALADRRLLAVRVGPGGALRIPADFLVVDPDSGELVVLASLRGTAILLSDSGFDDDASVRWLTGHDDTLRGRPVDALRSGRIHEVRRTAQAFAL